MTGIIIVLILCLGALIGIYSKLDDIAHDLYLTRLYTQRLKDLWVELLHKENEDE